MTAAAHALTRFISERTAQEASRVTEADIDAAQLTFDAAERAWENELRSLFGSAWPNARFNQLGRGAPGSLLHELWAAKDAARDAQIEVRRAFNAMRALRACDDDPDDVCTECDARRGSCRQCQSDAASDLRRGE